MRQIKNYTAQSAAKLVPAGTACGPLHVAIPQRRLEGALQNRPLCPGCGSLRSTGSMVDGAGFDAPPPNQPENQPPAPTAVCFG